MPPFVGISLALPLHIPERMLKFLKRRFNMSPLMLMMVLSLVPFPVLAIAILADHWIRPAPRIS
jgi:hypothetical protein